MLHRNGLLRCFTVEYCSSDTLVLNCREPEAVILVQRALYGRMSAGKCITSTYGESLGCRADVLQQLEDSCSGRPNCSMLVAVFDSLIQPCPRDFKSYLEISYECVRGSSSSSSICQQWRQAWAGGGQMGRLAPTVKHTG